MSDDIDDDDGLYLDDVLALGAAADSARTDAEVVLLPRLFRYAVTCLTSDVRATLAADVATIVPDLADEAARWAAREGGGGWHAFAARLDQLAVERDRPDLRGCADVARFAGMNGDAAARHRDDVVRVIACLRAVEQETDRGTTTSTYTSLLQQLIVGWTSILAGQDRVAYGHRVLAHREALRIGQRATDRVAAAVRDEIRREQWERAQERRAQAEEEQRERDERDRRDGEEDERPPGIPDGCVVVCPAIDLKANPKLRDITRGHEKAIGVPLPLVAVPDLANVRRRLVFEFPYAEYTIDMLLAPLVGRRFVRLPPAVLLGPPGAGKSRLARRLAEALGISVWRTDAARSDGAVFAGTDKRWYSAEPAHPFLAVSRTRTANPMILLDELEKAPTRSDYGRLWDTLLGFLEQETAQSYPDPALQVELDLSHVSYLATANTLAGLPAPILDRMRVIEMPEPRAGDLDRLLPPLLADIAAEQGVDPRWHPPLDAAERALVAGRWRGGSVRRLRVYTAVLVRARERTGSRH